MIISTYKKVTESPRLSFGTLFVEHSFYRLCKSLTRYHQVPCINCTLSQSSVYRSHGHKVPQSRTISTHTSSLYESFVAQIYITHHGGYRARFRNSFGRTHFTYERFCVTPSNSSVHHYVLLYSTVYCSSHLYIRYTGIYGLALYRTHRGEHVLT